MHYPSMTYLALFLDESHFIYSLSLSPAGLFIRGGLELSSSNATYGAKYH
jgi:hypothetical protein